jgi:hypothetical protein
MYSYCMFMYLHHANWRSSATLTEGFPCFFLIFKANARVKPAKMGHGPHSFKIFVSYVFFVCKCVLNYCHRVATQLQLTNIPVSIQTELRPVGAELFHSYGQTDMTKLMLSFHTVVPTSLTPNNGIHILMSLIFS